MGILKPVGELLANSIFIIPDYQRSFAWEDKQVDDLLDDIKESLHENANHYLGQVILDKVEKVKKFTIYNVIDGQQRLTSIILLLQAFCSGNKSNEINVLRIVDDAVIMKMRQMVSHLHNYDKTHLPIMIASKNNMSILQDIFSNNRPVQDNLLFTNTLLLDAYRRFEEFANSHDYNEDIFWKLYNSLLLLVKFDISDETEISGRKDIATRIFLSVNDRGKPLTILERLKSLIMYYDYKRLDGANAEKINESFSNLYSNLDYLNTKKEWVRSTRFEDGVLLTYFYHYNWKYLYEKHQLVATNSEIYYYYDKYAEGIYDDIRTALRAVDSDMLSAFITDLVSRLSSIGSILKDIVVDEKYKNIIQLINFLGISTRLHPLLIGLISDNGIDDEFIKGIELVDIYVYKAYGTDPRANLYRDITSEISLVLHKMQPELSIKILKDRMIAFAKSYETDCTMRQLQLTKYILWHYECDNNPNQSLDDLELYNKLQLEHILAKNYIEDNRYRQHGFSSKDQFEETVDRIGNLVLLEESINKAIGAMGPKQKADYYIGRGRRKGSSVYTTRKIGELIRNEQSGFSKKILEKRTKDLADYIKRKWEIKL